MCMYVIAKSVSQFMCLFHYFLTLNTTHLIASIESIVVKFEAINYIFTGHVAAVVCTHYLADLVLDTTAIEHSAHLQDVLLFQLQCAMEENCLSKSAYEVCHTFF